MSACNVHRGGFTAVYQSWLGGLVTSGGGKNAPVHGHVPGRWCNGSQGNLGAQLYHAVGGDLEEVCGCAGIA